MKKILFILLFFVATISFAQNDCKPFIEGKYFQEDNIAEGYIEFRDDFVYEIKGDEFIKSEIIWNDECSYTLKLIDSNIKDVVIPKGSELDVTIIDAKEDEFTITFNFMPAELSEPIRMVRYNG